MSAHSTSVVPRAPQTLVLARDKPRTTGAAPPGEAFPSIGAQVMQQMLAAARRPPPPPAPDALALGEAIVVAQDNLAYHAARHAVWQRVRELLAAPRDPASFATSVLSATDVGSLRATMHTLLAHTSNDLSVPKNWETLIGLSFDAIEPAERTLDSWLGLLSFLCACACIPSTPELAAAWQNTRVDHAETIEELWFVLQKHIDEHADQAHID